MATTCTATPEVTPSSVQTYSFQGREEDGGLSCASTEKIESLIRKYKVSLLWRGRGVSRYLLLHSREAEGEGGRKSLSLVLV